MIHAIATALLSVAAFTLARNGWGLLEAGNRVSAIAHFAVAGACLFGAGRAAWRWRRAVKRTRVPPRTPSPLPPNETSSPRNDPSHPSNASRPRAGKTTRRTKKRR